MTTTNPHPAGTKAAERWQRRMDKIAEKLRKQADLSAAQVEADKALAAFLPPKWQSWGATRTNAWSAARYKLDGTRRNISQDAVRLRAETRTLVAIADGTLSLEDCQELLR